MSDNQEQDMNAMILDNDQDQDEEEISEQLRNFRTQFHVMAKANMLAHCRALGKDHIGESWTPQKRAKFRTNLELA